MNKLISLSICVLFSFATIAQGDSYKAENEGWLVDVNEAYALSEKTGKPILANFTGSDWCGWCKRLTRSVFVKDEFKSWAKDNVVLLELDFPRRKSVPQKIKAQNRQLQQSFNVRGYPTIWMFYLSKKDNSDQFDIEALGKSGYTKTATKFISDMEKIMKNKA